MGIRSFIKRKVGERLGTEATPTAPAPSVQPLPRETSPDGFVAVAQEQSVAMGRGRTVVVRDEAVAIFRAESGWFAIDDACTHEDAPLGEGALE